MPLAGSHSSQLEARLSSKCGEGMTGGGPGGGLEGRSGRPDQTFASSLEMLHCTGKTAQYDPCGLRDPAYTAERH